MPATSAWPTPRELAALVAVRIAACGFAWRVGFRALSDDDYSRLVIAERFAQSPALDPSGTSWLPLPFWVYGGALRVFGTSLGLARASAIVLSVLATLALYVAARWLGASRRGALLGAALATLLEYSTLLGMATLPEVPCAALITLGAASLASDARARRLAGAFALCAACACRYEAWPVAGAFAALILRDVLRGRRELAPCLAVALAFPLAWLGYGALHHGSALFFVSRVTAYRHALDPSDAPLWQRLIFYPRLLVDTTLIVLVAVLALAQRLERKLALAPLCAALSLLPFLIAGSVSDGVPTHHAARALLPIWFYSTLLFGDALVRVFPRVPRALQLALAAVSVLGCARGLVRAQLTAQALADRREELAIGELARKAGAASLWVDTADYGYFAVIAAFGDAAHAWPVEAHDPRQEKRASPFVQAAAFDDFLRTAQPGWLVSTREHAPLVLARCASRAENERFLLARCTPEHVP